MAIHPADLIIVAAYVCGVVGFGFWIGRGRTDPADYLLAGRSISPMLVALSTVATMNSGFMFIGQIGFSYRIGRPEFFESTRNTLRPRPRLTISDTVWVSDGTTDDRMAPEI